MVSISSGCLNFLRASGQPPPLPPRFVNEEILELQRALADAAERTRAAARDRELMLAGISQGMDRDIDELDGIAGQFIDYVRDGRDEPLETVDLNAMLKALADDEARQGRAWRLSLPVAATLGGLPLALRRGLANLFDDAARHGAAPFEAGLAADGGDWRLTVRDRDPGVRNTARLELDRPFHRVDCARGTPGSGLGLASVARVAALHGGGLTLRNRDGAGLEVAPHLRIRPG